MRHLQLYRKISLLIIASVIFSARGAAQAPVDPGQLPERTSFYLLWRGTPTGEIRKNNSMYALWDDAEFGTARASFLEVFLNDTKSEKDKPTVSREELAQYVTLLDNAFAVGYVRRPEAHAETKSSAGRLRVRRLHLLPPGKEVSLFTTARGKRHCFPRRCCSCAALTRRSRS